MENSAPSQDNVNGTMDTKRDVSTPTPSFPSITVTSPDMSPENETHVTPSKSIIPTIIETENTPAKTSPFRPSRSVSDGADLGSAGSFNRLSSHSMSPPHGHTKNLNPMELRAENKRLMTMMRDAEASRDATIDTMKILQKTATQLTEKMKEKMLAQQEKMDMDKKVMQAEIGALKEENRQLREQLNKK